MQIGKGIIVGINWGGKGDYDPQKEIPDGSDIIGYNFIQRSSLFLEKYFSLDTKSINFNYTNLCFFRSPKIEDLNDEDYKKSLPLFHNYVNFINPEWILSLGYSNFKILLNNQLLNDVEVFKEGKTKFQASKAKLWGHDFYAVPHPNARVNSGLRKELWEWIGQERLKDKMYARAISLPDHPKL